MLYFYLVYCRNPGNSDNPGNTNRSDNSDYFGNSKNSDDHGKY